MLNLWQLDSLGGSTMNFNEDLRVHVCTELSAGDEIEAWCEGRLYHRGSVTELAPAAGVFWIMDLIGGGRKVLDLEDFHIVRVPQRSGVQATAA
jgi:hypothetical protein